MISALLKFFGVKIEDALSIVEMHLQLQNGFNGWFALLVIGLIALAWWTYFRRTSEANLSRARKIWLMGLRSALFLILLLLLLRPVLSFTIEGSIRRMFLTLVDTSTSMNIQDPRTDPMDLKRATLHGTPPEPTHVPRIELVKTVLLDPGLSLLPELGKQFDMAAFSFGQTMSELSMDPTKESLAWVAELSAKSPLTAIGDSIRDVLGRKRGQPLAGILLITDGASNSGIPVFDAGVLAKAEGVPLYIYGVGITSPKDILVGNLFTQDVGFLKDELPVTVRVRGQGLEGQSAKVVLKMGGEIVAEKSVEFGDSTEQAVTLNFTPQKVGTFEMEASVAPVADETIKDNNSVAQQVRIVDSKIKVLMVEQTPRWEFRFVQSDLLRDRRVELKCVLVESDPSVSEAANSPFLAKFPTTKEELFKYDLVMLGDVDPKLFSPAQLEFLHDFVSKFGGSLAFVAGRRFNPYAYRGSVLEKLLPVDLEAFETTTKSSGEKPIPIMVTPAGRTSPLLRLSPIEEENAAIWRTIPPLYWVNRVERAKPAAQVLLEDPDPAKASRFGKMPVIALQQFGLGQVLYVGTDNTWRWRKNHGEEYHTILWSQITQRMALAHLLGGSKRTQLSTDKQRYATGENVTVYARLYNEGFEPVKETSVEASYTVKGTSTGEKQSLQLRAVPEQPGMYRGEFVATSPGLHQLSVSTDAKTFVEFTAVLPRFELGETALNESLLKSLAEASGGAFFREEDLEKLPKLLGQKTERVQNVVDAELWSSPFFFLLLLAIATSEWILRKRSYLK